MLRLSAVSQSCFGKLHSIYAYRLHCHIFRSLRLFQSFAVSPNFVLLVPGNSSTASRFSTKIMQNMQHTLFHFVCIQPIFFLVKRWQNVFCRLWRKQMTLRLSKCIKGVDRLVVTFLKKCFSSSRVWSLVRFHVPVNGLVRIDYSTIRRNLPARQHSQFDIVPLGMTAVAFRSQIKSKVNNFYDLRTIEVSVRTWKWCDDIT